MIVDDPIARVAEELSRQLEDRQLEGALGSVQSDGSIRYQGTFRINNEAFLVDLRVLVRPDGAEYIVLTYVAIW